MAIEGTGGLVEDQELRLAQQCTRQRNPLSLAATEPIAALTHQGCEAFGKVTNEASGLGLLRGRLDLTITGLGIAKGNVVA